MILIVVAIFQRSIVDLWCLKDQNGF